MIGTCHRHRGFPMSIYESQSISHFIVGLGVRINKPKVACHSLLGRVSGKVHGTVLLFNVSTDTTLWNIRRIQRREPRWCSCCLTLCIGPIYGFAYLGLLTNNGWSPSTGAGSHFPATPTFRDSQQKKCDARAPEEWAVLDQDAQRRLR